MKVRRTLVGTRIYITHVRIYKAALRSAAPAVMPASLVKFVVTAHALTQRCRVIYVVRNVVAQTA